MTPHSLKSMAQQGAVQARIGLLEPISAQDSLALAWAKAAIMAELGASPSALQGEIARVMEPHAIGRGELARYEFEDADKITLKAMAASLSGRQARQLAQDVGLAAASVARAASSEPALAQQGGSCSMSGAPQMQQGLDLAADRVDPARWIGSFGQGSWIDPLASQGGARSEQHASGVASFARARLRFIKLPAA